MTPPVIIVAPKTQTMPIANSIRFQCKAEGNPTPVISWYHNGHPLKLVGKYYLICYIKLIFYVYNKNSLLYQVVSRVRMIIY